MVNGRNYIRLLRHLGVALIFAPEPFTTPFGVACILAARHLSKQHEANVNNRLREMVRYYLTRTAHFGDYVDGGSYLPDPSKPPRSSEEHPILGQITGGRSFEANPSVRKAKHELRESTAERTTDTQILFRPYRYEDGFSDTFTGTQKVVHHTIDTEWLSRRYESASAAVAHSSWTTTSGCGEGVTRHSLNTGVLCQRYRTGSIEQVKTTAHSRDVAQLRQRHASAPDYTAIHRALRDYSYHCDMLSRRNVIEG